MGAIYVVRWSVPPYRALRRLEGSVSALGEGLRISALGGRPQGGRLHNAEGTPYLGRCVCKRVPIPVLLTLGTYWFSLSFCLLDEGVGSDQFSLLFLAIVGSICRLHMQSVSPAIVRGGTALIQTLGTGFPPLDDALISPAGGSFSSLQPGISPSDASGVPSAWLPLYFSL
jgi:hypothetical protein